MGFFFETKTDDTDVGEWVAWGGITRPTVMRQRGGSYFSVIAYRKYRRTAPLLFPDFRRGWVISNEHHHFPAGNGREAFDMDYLVILWNPFVSMGSTYVENPLDLGDGKKRVRTDRDIDYFVHVVKRIQEELSKATLAWVLEYQELMDFISFSATLGDDHVEMPEIPLYMDYLLTQNNTFYFGGNSISVNGKKVFVVTLADIMEPEALYALFPRLPFRHVRRLLCMSREESKVDMKKYTGQWCTSRGSMKKALMRDIESNINGYYHDGIYFHLTKEQRSFPEFLRKQLDNRGIFYCFERYNLKDIWWGSLPGNFLANVVPPSIGFASLEDILSHPMDVAKAEKRKQFDDRLIASLKRKKIAEGESSSAMFETEEQIQQRKEGLEYVQD